MSQNWDIRPFTFKEASNIFKSVQRHDTTHNGVIFDAEVTQRKRVRACVSTVARVAGFPCSTKIPNIH